MTKFSVTLYRDQLESTQMEVEAESKEQAREVAERDCKNVPLSWESCGKGGATEPYVGEDDEITEVK